MLDSPAFEWRYPQTILQLYRQLEDLEYPPDVIRSVRDAYDLAAALFSGRYVVPGGKPLLTHCVGAAGILASLRAPGHLLSAALLHNVYQAGDFGDGKMGPTPARRREVREAVGEAAESVVAGFAELRLHPASVARLLDRLGSLEPVERDALLVWAADHLEHHLDLGYLHRQKRDGDAEKRRLAIGIALEFGLPQLADEMRRVHAETDSATATEAYRPRGGGYFLAPRSYRRGLGVRLRRRVRRLRPRRPSSTSRPSAAL
jgi:(p)ppGpp synthase/HD superfamily hydrolase